jgi:hypothetical protein
MFHFVCFALLAVVALAFAWLRVDRAARMPLLVYCGTYGFTTLIGATIIGLRGPAFLDTLNYSLDSTILPDLDGIKYWGLLYAPLILPPLCLALTRSQPARLPSTGARSTPAEIKRSAAASDRLGVVPFLLGFGLLTGYCMFRLAAAGYGNNLSAWSSLKGDYISLILLRTSMATSLGSVFFGLVYIAIPCLSQCAMYQYLRSGRSVWKFVFLLTVAVTGVLCVWIMMKGLLLIYLLFLGIGLIELKVVKPRVFILIVAGVLGVLTVLQGFFSDNWSFSDSASLAVFRMASSYPYYVSLFPDVIPYGGLDLGLHLLGLAKPNTDAIDVWAYMYPSIHWVQGATPAAAHMRAYAEGGVVYSLVMLVGIGFLLRAVTTFRQRVEGPFAYALYMQALVFLYYLTQTSIREAVISCYGFFWAVVAIGLVQMLSQLDRMLVPSAALVRR